MKALRNLICRRLKIDNFKFVEIESKKRVLPKEAKALRKFLHKSKKIKFEKMSHFFDQFLDTPQLDLLKKGVSLRIRYKGGGNRIYVQYKGPGYLEDQILFRSEFSSGNLDNLILEESHHDIIRFTQTSINRLLNHSLPKAMTQAMRDHLGRSVVSRISAGPIISLYRKEKFAVNMGSAFLEPSLDRVFAFHISRKGLHPLSTFWELENEIKSTGKNLDKKIELIPQMREFNARLEDEFDLQPEPLDKYHRCCSIFLPASKRWFPPES